jgi:hypothetical protein
VHRELILVPPAVVRIEESTPIGPGYPKEYTAREMREWAEASERLEQVLEQDRVRSAARKRLSGWLADPVTQLTPEQQRLVASYQQLYVDRAKGISGTLNDRGRLVLDAGKHRTYYLCERAGASVPTWVSCANRRQLTAFRDECEQYRTRARDERIHARVSSDLRSGESLRTVPEEVRVALGRTALLKRSSRAPEAFRTEAKESARERDTLRDERDL